MTEAEKIAGESRKITDERLRLLRDVVERRLAQRRADEIERLATALELIEFRSTNHGGWFEQDPFGEYVKLGNIARDALSPRRALSEQSR